MKALKQIRIPIIISVFMFLICGLVYPLATTGLAQLFFPHQANGSLIEVDGQIVGAEFVGQQFSDLRFMQSRPSAVNYNVYTQEEKENGLYEGVASGSDNYAPSNPKLLARVEQDMKEFLAAHPTIKAEDIPADLMTASGSGLDPHISPESAAIQIPALAEHTGLSEKTLAEIVAHNTEGKLIGVFGEERVNVLKVNLEIAQMIGILPN